LKRNEASNDGEDEEFDDNEYDQEEKDDESDEEEYSQFNKKGKGRGRGRGRGGGRQKPNSFYRQMEPYKKRNKYEHQGA
jgi:hypothetical protein